MEKESFYFQFRDLHASTYGTGHFSPPITITGLHALLSQVWKAAGATQGRRFSGVRQATRPDTPTLALVEMFYSRLAIFSALVRDLTDTELMTL